MKKYTDWYTSHLVEPEPMGHGIASDYLAKLNVTLAEEHTFQHSRDKRAGIDRHRHNMWEIILTDARSGDPK